MPTRMKILSAECQRDCYFELHLSGVPKKTFAEGGEVFSGMED